MKEHGYILLFGSLTAFVVVLFTMPSLIKVARMKHLVDEPSEERKLHQRSVPTIGGIIIFAYDSKIGDEKWFFAAAAPYLSGQFEWKGEDGEMWKWTFDDGQMFEWSAVVQYADDREVAL